MTERLPAAPSHLSERMQSYWQSVVREFLISDHQLEILRKACEASDRADEAREILASEGLTVEDRYGQARPHPASQIERDSRTAFARLIRELALEPGSDGGTPEDARPPRTGSTQTARSR